MDINSKKRELLKKLGIVGGASFLAPTVFSDTRITDTSIYTEVLGLKDNILNRNYVIDIEDGDPVLKDPEGNVYDIVDIPFASAVVYKKDNKVIAKSWTGSKWKIIAQGEAGVDDAEVIQSALNVGGRIFIAKGTYICSQTIKIKDVVVEFEKGVELKLGNSVNADLIQVAGTVVLKGEATLNGNNTNNGAGILINAYDSIEKLVVDGLTLKYYPERGIRALETLTHNKVIIRNCKILYSDTLPEHKAGGWAISGKSEYLLVENCEMINIPNDAINYFGNIIRISNNTIKNTPDGGLHVVPVSESAEIVIENNHIENVQSFKGIGVGTDDGSVNLYNARVVNNFIKDVGGQSAIRIQYAYECIIEGNIIDGCPDGIVIALGGSGNTITNNRIRNITGTGIYARNNNNVIEGNVIDSPNNGIQLYNAYDNLIVGNRVKNAENISIYEQSGDYNVIIGNDVRGSATGISTTGTNTVIRRNIGYTTENSGTATFSGDGSTTQFKIAHGLVSTPSKVLVTPMTSDAAGDFYVTADDTYIYVNYKTAPPSGSNNIKLSWYVEV